MPPAHVGGAHRAHAQTQLIGNGLGEQPRVEQQQGLRPLARGAKTINEIGQEYGVHPVQVGQWKRGLQEQAKTLFQTRRGPAPVSPQSDPDRLYGEIGRLKMDLDWLKKKSGISLP